MRLVGSARWHRTRWGIGVVLAAVLPGQEASGGAWTLAEGDGIAISTVERKVTPLGGLVGGEVEEDQTAVQVFVEYGLIEELTVGFTAFGKFSLTDDRTELRFGGHGRYRLWQGNNGDVASIQAGFGLPAERWLGGGLGDNRPDSVPEADIRALYGKGWALDWANAFVSTEAGFRWRGEGQADEVRIDTIAGIEPWRGIQGLLGVFAAVPLGDGRTDQETSLKLAPSFAYTLWPSLGDNDKKPSGPIAPSTIQVGVIWDVLSPDDGLGLSVSVWQRF